MGSLSPVDYQNYILNKRGIHYIYTLPFCPFAKNIFYDHYLRLNNTKTYLYQIGYLMPTCYIYEEKWVPVYDFKKEEIRSLVKKEMIQKRKEKIRKILLNFTNLPLVPVDLIISYL